MLLGLFSEEPEETLLEGRSYHSQKDSKMHSSLGKIDSYLTQADVLNFMGQFFKHVFIKLQTTYPFQIPKFW